PGAPPDLPGRDPPRRRLVPRASVARQRVSRRRLRARRGAEGVARGARAARSAGGELRALRGARAGADSVAARQRRVTSRASVTIPAPPPTRMAPAGAHAARPPRVGTG